MVVPDALFPTQPLLDAVHTMRALLSDAKARREGRARTLVVAERRPRQRQLTAEEQAAMTVSLRRGELVSRALEYTMQDMVEDLALLYNTVTTRISRAQPVTTRADAHRVERIAAATAGFATDLKDKHRHRALMHPYKRDLLAKLMVVKSLLTAGNADFVYGQRPPWSAPVCPPPSIPTAVTTHVKAQPTVSHISASVTTTAPMNDAAILQPQSSDVLITVSDSSAAVPLDVVVAHD